MRLNNQLRNVVSSRWARMKLVALASFARLLGVHLGLWRDLQNVRFWIVALERPTSTQQLAAHLYPGAGTDVYFPAPTQPEIMWIEAFDSPPGPRSLGRSYYYDSLIGGLCRVYDAAHRLRVKEVLPDGNATAH